MSENTRQSELLKIGQLAQLVGVLPSKINFYTNGTTNDLDTFPTVALSGANANPLILDSDGRVLIRTDGSINVSVDQTKLDKIWDAENIIIKASIETTKNDLGEVQYVKFYSEYSLSFKFGAGARISITQD